MSGTTLALWRTSHSVNMSALALAPLDSGAGGAGVEPLQREALGVLSQYDLGGRRRWLTLSWYQW